MNSGEWQRFIDLLRQRPLPTCVVLCPVFDDFESAVLLAADLAQALPADAHRDTLLLLVNDGSSEVPPRALFAKPPVRTGVLHLKANLGHQRAIAVGLGFIAQWVGDDAIVVVMDADGEDRPQHLPRLLALVRDQPGAIAVANRARRQESAGFRLGYLIYRTLFRLLTGRGIRNGNFSAMSGRIARRIAHTPGLWNHYAATLHTSRIQIVGTDVDRGVRYRGQSKMNSIGLIVYGLSGIAVHMDVAGVRMLMGAILLSLLAGIGFLTVALVRFATDLAIPGWASTVGGSFIILAALGILASAQLVFTVLASRERLPVVVALEAVHFVERLELSE
jgi:polyisoprenyl-phosphate glycosyltransferase